MLYQDTRLRGPLELKNQAKLHLCWKQYIKRVFQCDNGSEFKRDVTKLLEKHRLDIYRITTKNKYTKKKVSKTVV